MPAAFCSQLVGDPDKDSESARASQDQQ